MAKTARTPAAAGRAAASACGAFLLEDDRSSVGFNDGAAVTVGAADGVAVVGLDVVGAAGGSRRRLWRRGEDRAAVRLPGVAVGAASGAASATAWVVVRAAGSAPESAWRWVPATAPDKSRHGLGAVGLRGPGSG